MIFVISYGNLPGIVATLSEKSVYYDWRDYAGMVWIYKNQKTYPLGNVPFTYATAGILYTEGFAIWPSNWWKPVSDGSSHWNRLQFLFGIYRKWKMSAAPCPGELHRAEITAYRITGLEDLLPFVEYIREHGHRDADVPFLTQIQKGDSNLFGWSITRDILREREMA